MRVESHDEVLRRLAEEQEYAPKGWDPDVIKSYRKKVQLISAAQNERDLYAMRGLRLEKLKGDRLGQTSMRLNDQFRLILTFRTEGDRVAVLLEVVDSTDSNREIEMSAVLAEAFPAGEFLADELEARGWTQAEFAAILDRPAQFVSEIISGKKEITRESAAQIGAALGTSAEMWLSLQDKYFLWKQNQDTKAQSDLDDVRRRARLNEKGPVAVLKKAGVLTSKSLDDLEGEVLRFFELKSLDEEPRLAAAAKRSNHGESLSALQTSWLYMVRHAARKENPTGTYSRKALEAIGAELPRVAKKPQDFAALPEILGGAGVRLVYVPGLPGAKIDGCAMIVDQIRVIGLSGRGKRLDKVLFALIHEVAHHTHGHVQDDKPIVETIEVDDDPDDQSDEAAQEREANNTAAMWVFPDGLPPLPERLSGPWVLETAAKAGIAPIMVVGHLQHLKKLDWRTTLAKGAPNVDSFLSRWDK